jgi:uncharacterized protein (TIGR03435 family)
MARREITAGALVLAACTFPSLHGQAPQATPSERAQTPTATTTPLAFDVVSVKPAAPGAFPIVPAFMRDKGSPILGLQRMAAPVSLMIGYAYHMQMNETSDAFRKQPDWVKTRVYTVTFRAEGEPTRDQVREMMRTMLAERFGLQIHEYTREGTVNRLSMIKPGVLGPNIKRHPEGASCSTQEGASVGEAPEAQTAPKARCGFTWYYLPSRALHVGWTDTTIADAARSLAGLGAGVLATRPLVDATGLTGKYDLTLEFLPDSGGPFTDPDADDGGVPTLTRAIQEQLGMRVESSPGAVRMVMIDHVVEPTSD